MTNEPTPVSTMMINIVLYAYGRDRESDALDTCLVRFRTTVTDHTGAEIRGKVRDRVVVFRGWRERV